MDLARNLKVESVSRLQPAPALQVRPSQTVAEAIALMREQRTGCVLICEQGQLVGIFTERDLMRRVLATGKPLTLTLAEVMTPAPVVVQTKQAIGVAIHQMQEGGYRHLPVVDELGKPVGMLSVKRIIRYLVEHFPGAVYNLPPDPGAVQQEREGA
jgi:CBS domain-containing protein